MEGCPGERTSLEFVSYNWGKNMCGVGGGGEDLEESKLNDYKIPESSVCGLKI